MPIICCTPRLHAVGPTEPTPITGNTVQSVLDAADATYPKLKNYVLDDQGNIRKHVAIFVNGELADPSKVLDMTVDEQTEVYVMQALSGG